MVMGARQNLKVFFDTEFTELGANPRLISIGLIAEDDARAFYAELTGTWSPEHVEDNFFVRDEVLPKLEGGDARMTMAELVLRLGSWFEDFGQPVQLATDSLAWDWPWIQQIFGAAKTWPANLENKPLLLTMFDLNHYAVFEEAVEQAFADGLRRHHALDDAMANRLGWIAARDGNLPG